VTIMNFIGCEFLRKIPDVSRIPNLEKLDLGGCKNLVEVHPSIGFHDKLVSLKLEGCYNLRSFPRSLKMRSLKFLNLWGCSRLKNFPEIKCQMECLKEINIGKTGIEELPSSIGYLVGVKVLCLNGYTNLMTLPDSIHKLKHLETLLFGDLDLIIQPILQEDEYIRMSSVSKLLPFPPSTNTSDSNNGCSLIVFPKLRVLKHKNCALSKLNFFRTFDWCTTLAELDLSMSDIVTIPPYIRQFVRLKFLSLLECKQLREILGIPPNLMLMSAKGCVSLAIFLQEARRSPLFDTPKALFQVGTIFPALSLGNHVLTESEFLIQRDCPSSLTFLDLSGSAIVSLPTWFSTFVGLNDLYLKDCNQLEEIPELPPKIVKVCAGGCTSLERFEFNNIKDLPNLRRIDFSNCHGLRENMGDDLQIRLLIEVSLFHIYTLYLYVL
jgi:Leucine-rich repeat (LRR) protein